MSLLFCFASLAAFRAIPETEKFIKNIAADISTLEKAFNQFDVLQPIT